MTKYIREARFGAPKSQKTRMVTGTYPKPMLVLEYDPGGMTVDLSPGYSGPITWVKVDEAIALLKKPTAELPQLVVVDMAGICTTELDVAYSPLKDAQTFPETIKLVNALVRQCPFKTVVLDTITGLSDAIYGHQAVMNTAALADARKWAGNIGMKVKQVIEVTHRINAHTVTIFHEETDKNELTGEIRTFPMMYSKVREMVAALFDQFVQATEVGGKPVIITKASGLVKGIGMRWPSGLPEKCPADFQSIYGKEKLS